MKNESLLYKGSKKAARKYIHVLDACRACAKAISKKYDITNISKKKIFYKNFPNEGHYISEPKKFIPRRGINLNLIKYQDFKKGLTSQYIERKKKYKL